MSFKTKKFVGCRGYSNTATSVPSSTWTPIEYGATAYDTVGNIHSNVTNNSRFTIPFNGHWYCCGMLRWPDSSGGTKRIGLRVNGTTFYGIQSNRVGDAVNQYLTVGGTILMNAGDYVELVGWQNSGGSVSTVSGESNTVVALLATTV